MTDAKSPIPLQNFKEENLFTANIFCGLLGAGIGWKFGWYTGIPVGLGCVVFNTFPLVSAEEMNPELIDSNCLAKSIPETYCKDSDCL